MIFQYLVIENIEAIQKAETLGLDEPKPVYTSRDIVLDIADIGHARITRDGDIEIELKGDYYLLKFNKQIWETIVKEIDARENSR